MGRGKRFLALFLSAAMAVTGVNISMPSTVEAAGENPVVEPAKPVVALPFDDAGEVTLKGAAILAKDPDNDKNNVLQVETTGGGINGNYAIANSDLSSYDFSNGVTVSLNVRPKANSLDWNYLFAIGQTETHVKAGKKYKFCDGTIGFIARYGQPDGVFYPGNGWQDGNPVESKFNYFTVNPSVQDGPANDPKDVVDKWYRMTYVYSSSEVSIYVNGILTCKHTPVAANINQVLPILKDGHLVLGAGAREGALENFGGYIDDVYVYDQALDGAAVATIETDAPKSFLGEVLKAAAKMKEVDYTSETWATFSGALTAAQAAYDNSETTKAQFMEQKKLLETAMEGLQLVPGRVLPEEVVLEKTSEDLFVGRTLQINAQVTPDNASDKALTYTSSDTEVATVSETGLVTAKKEGKTVITAEAYNGVNNKCTIAVREFRRPVAEVSFEDENQVELKGEAKIEAESEENSNKVLSMTETAVGADKGGNFAIATADLSKFDFSNGVTVSMKFKSASTNVWNYLFAIGKTKSSGGYNYCDGTIGFNARYGVGSWFLSNTAATGWVDGNPVNSADNAFTKTDKDTNWHRMTYVYSPSATSIYLDGKIVCTWRSDNKLKEILPGINEGHLVLGAGASEEDLETFGGSIDDVYVYDAALNDTAVANLEKERMKFPLFDTLEKAQALKEAEYTSASWTTFAAALKTAQDVFYNPNAEETALTEQKTALEKAMTDLVKRGDKTALAALITTAKGLMVEDDKDLYDASVWDALAQAIDDAEKLDDDVTQEQVDAIKDALQTAVNNFKPSNITKEVLDKLVTKAEAEMEGKKQTAYTPEVWNALKTAITEAKAVAADAAKEVIEAAYNKLQTALTNFQPKPTVLVKEITLDKTSETLYVKETLQLQAQVTPDDASNPDVKYTSSDKAVATVSDTGLVTAVAEGTTVITVEAADEGGASAQCTIKVEAEHKPVIALPFNDDSAVELKGKAKVVADPDDAINNVLLVDETAGGRNGNYAIAKNDLSELDFSKGLTVSMKVRPTANASDWHYLFAVGQTKTQVDQGKGYKFCDGTIGFIARYGQPDGAHYPNDGWAEGNPVESKFNYFTTNMAPGVQGTNDPSAVVNKWYRMTFVYSPDEVCIYVDGILTCKHKSKDQIGEILSVLKNGNLVIGAGAAEGDDNNFGGYIDDVYVYDAPLSARAVSDITKNEKPADPEVNAARLALLTVLNTAKGLKETDYTSASWTAFKAILNTAQGVYNDPQADKAALEEQKTLLENAMKAEGGTLKKRGDKTALNALITNAEKQMNPSDKDLYEESVWNALAEAIDAARKLGDDVDQAAVDAQLAALQTAYDNFTPKDIKAALTTMLAQAKEKMEGKNKADYEESVWNALEDAISAAEKVDANTSLADTKTIYNNLRTAMDNFEPKKVETVPVTAVTLDTTSKTMKIGEKLQLTATVQPSNATDQTITYTSSAEDVATVSKTGLVEAVKEGTATITATAVGGAKAECKITVEKEETPSVIDKTALNTLLKEAKDLKNGKEPYEYEKAVWTALEQAITEAETVANAANATEAQIKTAYDNLKKAKDAFKPKEINKTTLGALNTEAANAMKDKNKADYEETVWNALETAMKAVENLSANATETQIREAYKNLWNALENFKPKGQQTEVPVTGVTLNKEKTTLTVGGTETLTAAVAPANATNKAVAWETSNAGVATVVNGKVTAVKAGTAVITAASAADKSKKATCTVTVRAAASTVRVQSVTLNVKKLTLGVKESYTLKATVKPSSVKNKKVTWKSDKPKIVTVKNGKLTAKKTGKAKITVTSQADKKKKATVTVTVKKAPTKKTTLTLNKKKVTLKTKGKSKTFQIKPKVKGSFGSGTFKYTIDKKGKKAVKVDKNGKVTAKKKGKATITVKTYNGKAKAVLKVTVK